MRTHDMECSKRLQLQLAAVRETEIFHDASERGFGFIVESFAPGVDTASMPDYLQTSTGFSGTFLEGLDFASGEHSIQWAELYAIVVQI